VGNVWRRATTPRTGWNSKNYHKYLQTAILTGKSGGEEGVLQKDKREE